MISTRHDPLYNALAGFLVIIMLLILIGFIFIYSSSSIFALEKIGTSHYFVTKQFFGFLLGLVGLVICRLIPLNLIKKMAPWAFLSALIMTSLTLIPRFSLIIHGSRRWLTLSGITFQPSELLKIALILYLAYIINKKQFSLNSFIYGYMPFLLILGVTSCVLLKQPDFGQIVTTAIMALILFFVAQVNTKHLLWTVIALVPIATMLIYLKPYRFKRILIFLDPWQDPKGSGFQIIQSLIAIGSGNIWGLGISNSKQKFFYLPMQHTDFIFSIIAEETGFLGACALVSLYCAFLYVGLNIARQLKDPFASYITLGFVLLVSIQALINIAVTTGLVPTKGLGLPFVSYGLSSLISNMCMVGIIINCVQSQTKQHSFVMSERYSIT